MPVKAQLVAFGLVLVAILLLLGNQPEIRPLWSTNKQTATAGFAPTQNMERPEPSTPTSDDHREFCERNIQKFSKDPAGGGAWGSYCRRLLSCNRDGDCSDDLYPILIDPLLPAE